MSKTVYIVGGTLILGLVLAAVYVVAKRGNDKGTTGYEPDTSVSPIFRPKGSLTVSPFLPAFKIGTVKGRG